MASSFGMKLVTTIFGESHGPVIGATIEGLPAGEQMDTVDLQQFMSRRAGGKTYTTARREADMPEVLSGIKDGRTTGMPLTIVIRNGDMRSGDYASMATKLRPSHVDYPAFSRYGDNFDYRGGGHFSGRLSAALCSAGGIAKQILQRRNIEIYAHIIQVGATRNKGYYEQNLSIDDMKTAHSREIPVNDDTIALKMIAEINAAKNDGDSIGGAIECVAFGLPVGVGEPLFDGIENHISKAIFGIGGVRGIEFGVGFAAAGMRGSQHNDSYKITKGKVDITTNSAGGVLGGMSTGEPLVLRVALKPTPTISKEQSTVDIKNKISTTLAAGGRHDPCIVPRAVPCVESAVALAILDLLLLRGL